MWNDPWKFRPNPATTQQFGAVVQKSNFGETRQVKADPRDGYLLFFPRNLTVQQVVTILRSGRMGDLWQLHSLVEAMLDSWPMLKKCQHELRTAVSQAKFKVTPYADHGKKPTKRAQDKADLVSKAMASMNPDPATDEKAFSGMVYDLANAYLLGITICEIQWDESDPFEILPRAATFVHPRHIVFDNSGRIQIADADSGQTIPFDPDYFLCSQFQSQSGSVLGNGMIRPVGGWWAMLMAVQQWMYSSSQQWGAPFLCVQYARQLMGNKPELDKIENMLDEAGNKRQMMMPADSEGKAKFDVIMPGNLGPDNPQRYIKEQADKEVQMLFLGQNASTENKTGGLNNDDSHMDVLQEHKEAVTAWIAGDGVKQFAKAVLRKNFGDDTECPIITADFTKAETKLEAATRWQTIANTAKALGAPVALVEFYEDLDLTMPEEGDQVLLNGKAGTLGEMSNPIQPNPTLEEQVEEQAAMYEAAGGGQVQASEAGHSFRGNQWTKVASDPNNDPEGTPKGKLKHAVLIIGGKRYRGATHLNAMIAFTNAPDFSQGHSIREGFETESGHFLTREQAAKYVGKTGKLGSSGFRTAARDGLLYTEQAVMARDASLSSTQLTLTQKQAIPFIEFAKMIPDSDLFVEDGNYGREFEPHITVLYGLKSPEEAKARQIVSRFSQFRVRMLATSIFECERYDVLKVGVDSDQLRYLNAALSKLPHESSHPGYEPHLTIAYLKKGAGKKYANDERFKGMTFNFDSVTFSPPSEMRDDFPRTEMPLTGVIRARESDELKKKVPQTWITLRS